MGIMEGSIDYTFDTSVATSVQGGQFESAGRCFQAKVARIA